ncbi:MAG TPA: hypothetical protein VJI98_03075 [Candidatus Nanoarchaeia archaeon]|nr:hypothetical protein [Candidatus Nanoarchaeia archaeon]
MSTPDRFIRAQAPENTFNRLWQLADQEVIGGDRSKIVVTFLKIDEIRGDKTPGREKLPAVFVSMHYKGPESRSAHFTVCHDEFTVIPRSEPNDQPDLSVLLNDVNLAVRRDHRRLRGSARRA